jgi:DNA sulfur modification protein DndE
MFSHIRTSKKNKEIVTKLTNQLKLGAENVIARIALAYSIEYDTLELKDLKDSKGKEYSSQVLFGDNFDQYIGMICCHYNLYKSDKDIPKYIKLHIDNGLELLNKELEVRANVDGFDFLIEKIESKLLQI